eukprot:TRINITY_DN8955_c0_g2_i1.p1 TRINITY_DN8955_c0_g2~~TRINITY_DN8955_c0_g2_i1.p1  ORF type:complete len:320 (-),score=25.91 TRINITY_DN8955_c0_g2_i1:209-1168(-)
MESSTWRRRPKRFALACTIWLTVACSVSVYLLVRAGEDGQQESWAFVTSPRNAQSAQPSRRSMFMLGVGASSWLAQLPGLASDRAAHAEEASAAGSAKAEEDCSCCEKDWCGCGGECFDCYDHLKKLGYKMPLDAPAAVAAAGTAWRDSLNWKSAKLPGWRPTKDEYIMEKNSSIEGAGQGLFAKVGLPRGAVMPPYGGRMLKFSESKVGGPYAWCPVGSADAIGEMDETALKSGPKSKEISYCVDGEATTNEDNPSRLINAAGSPEECAKVNTEICEIGKVMYFRTTRPIAAGEELVTDYGNNYWEDLQDCGVHLLLS